MYFCLMIDREITGKLKQLLRYYPIVSLNGPRQSGKSTILKNTFPKLDYISLENPDDYQLAKEDPKRFLSNFSKGAILDEVQHAPELFNYIQTVVDSNPKIKFVLSGSQNFLINHKISQSLAGRVGILTLLPLTLQEIASYKGNTFETRAFQGFYPRVFDKKIPPSLFYPSYVQTYIQRDVLQLLRISDVSLFQKFLRMLANRAGQSLNMNSLANDVGVALNTIKAWISVLEASYIVYLLKPYYKNFDKRLSKTPKIYFYDTGLLCYLLGITEAKQITHHFARGHIFENMVIIDILKTRLNKANFADLYFIQDKLGREIDLVIEKNNSLVAIEIKSSETKSNDFFDNLQYFTKTLTDTIQSRFVIYIGDTAMKTIHGEYLQWKALDKILQL
jgi:uncharacterized protein